MRAKFLACVAALAVATPVVLATGAPASAQRWHGYGWHGYRGPGIAGLAAGAVIGGVAAAAAAAQPWTWPYYGDDAYYPGYGNYDPGYAAGPGYAPGDGYGYDDEDAYQPAPGYAAPGYAAPGYASRGYAAPGYAAAGRDDAYCTQRYRSYDPASGTFLGYDGVRHPCP